MTGGVQNGRASFSAGEEGPRNHAKPTNNTSSLRVFSGSSWLAGEISQQDTGDAFKKAIFNLTPQHLRVRIAPRA